MTTVTTLIDDDFDFTPNPDEAAEVRAQLLAEQEAKGLATVKVEPQQEGDCDFTLAGVDDVSPLPIAGKMSEEEFWQARDYLAYARQYAHSKVLAPYAFLLAALVKVDAELPYLWVAPAVVGSEASLNYYGVLLDNSGGGKSSVSSAVRKVYPWTTGEAGITSGEGIITSYLSRRKGEDGDYVTDYKTRALLLSTDESQALLAVQSRHGSTAFAHLKTLWTGGGGIDINNKSEAEKMRLDFHSARTALLIGGQPVAMDSILIDDGTGIAERFVVMRLEDPTLPRLLPDEPQGRMPMRLGHLPTITEQRAFTYDRRIVEFLRESRWATATGNAMEVSVISPAKYGKVPGHRNLVIAKTAILFAAWDGRTHVTYEDWALAVHFLTVSGESRKWAVERLNAAREADNAAAGVASGKRELASETVKDAATVGKVANSLIRRMKALKEQGADSAREKDLTRNLSDRQREYADDAIDVLVASGQLVVEVRPSAAAGKSDDVRWFSLGVNA